MRKPTDTQLGARRRNPRRASPAPRTLQIAMDVLGVSDVELGDRLGVSRQTIHSWRTGRTPMKVDTIHALADALDIEPALFTGRPSAAVRWLGEHRADALDSEGAQGELSRHPPGSRCTLPVAARRAPMVFREVGTVALAGLN